MLRGQIGVLGVLGVNELGLRLVPWLSGLVALVLFWRVATRFLVGIPLLAALLLFAVSPRLVLLHSRRPRVPRAGGDPLVPRNDRGGARAHCRSHRSDRSGRGRGVPLRLVQPDPARHGNPGESPVSQPVAGERRDLCDGTRAPGK